MRVSPEPGIAEPGYCRYPSHIGGLVASVLVVYGGGLGGDQRLKVTLSCTHWVKASGPLTRNSPMTAT